MNHIQMGTASQLVSQACPYQPAALQRALVNRFLGIPLLLAQETSSLVPCPEKRPVPPRQLVGLDAPNAISSVHQDLEAILEAINAKNGELILEPGAISSIDQTVCRPLWLLQTDPLSVHFWLHVLYWNLWKHVGWVGQPLVCMHSSFVKKTRYLSIQANTLLLI